MTTQTANWAVDEKSLNSLVKIQTTQITGPDETCIVSFTKNEKSPNNLGITIAFSPSHTITSLILYSSARIMEVYANENAEYVGTFKNSGSVSENIYICEADTNRTFKSLTIKFLSNSSKDKNRVDVFGIHIQGAPISEEQANKEYESMLTDPSALMGMLGGGMGNILQQLQQPQISHPVLPNPQTNDIEALIELKMEQKLKDVVTRIVDERMLYWEDRILKKIQQEK